MLPPDHKDSAADGLRAVRLGGAGGGADTRTQEPQPSSDGEGLTFRSRPTISLDQVGTYCTLAVLNSCTRDSTALLEWMS